MAGNTLPVLSSPQFPQVFTEAIDRAVDRIVFGICCYEEPVGTWNDHNAVHCNSAATVHNLEDGLDYCERHHRKVVSLG
jgi:hypothetical protein